MTIVGTNFTKINVERKNAIKGKINISNNVSIKSVEEANFSLGTSEQKGARFVFEFTSKYEPELGEIYLSGDVLFVATESEIKAIIEKWNKEKKIDQKVMSGILNGILNKCNVQALILSQTMNLPSPIPLPKVSNQTQQGNSGEAKSAE
ncbi:MAG: hypothetical protein ACLFPQ_02695 [Candidatus Woesearchaeota archaeon]